MPPLFRIKNRLSDAVQYAWNDAEGDALLAHHTTENYHALKAWRNSLRHNTARYCWHPPKTCKQINLTNDA